LAIATASTAGFLGGIHVASAERSPTLESRLESCLDFQTHRLAGKLLFDGHGLTPYWGLVNAFEPEHKDEIGEIEVLDDSFVLETSRNWNGKIADPNGQLDNGLYEYKYALWCDRDGQERGADFTFRPGYPNATHVESGDQIGGMPSACPESFRVHVEATNLSATEVLELLRALASRIDLNPNYFDEPHEWSSIYALEVYARVDRDHATSALSGKGGILEQLAQFSKGQGRGVHKWNHEQIQGHYEGVALDPDSWARLIPSQTLPKRLKCYQPEYVRAEDDGDPLYHHKLECQYWSGYFPKGEGSISWDGYDAAIDELEQTALCALNWAGLPLKPDPDVYIEDGYFAPRESDSETELVSNPLPEIRDQHQDGARLALMDPTATRGEWDILSAVAEYGGGHHAELASKAGRSSSTAYRAIEQFDAVLNVDNGRISFIDEIVRDGDRHRRSAQAAL
jgi:hypothetical protein